MKYTFRPRRLEVRDPSKPPGYYLPCPPPPKYLNAWPIPGWTSCADPLHSDLSVSSPRLHAWLRKGKLYPDQRKKSEGPLMVAIRTLRYMGPGGAGWIPYKSDYETMAHKRFTFEDLFENNGTDCGGKCAVFAVVMRLHRIPHGYIMHAPHVQNQIYVPGAGWVTVDAGAGVVPGFAGADMWDAPTVRVRQEESAMHEDGVLLDFDEMERLLGRDVNGQSIAWMMRMAPGLTHGGQAYFVTFTQGKPREAATMGLARVIEKRTGEGAWTKEDIATLLEEKGWLQGMTADGAKAGL